MYTVTVTNTGQVPYTEDMPASFTDDLTDVLDDATFNDDATADVGEVTYAEPELSWSGALAPGEVATITFTATVIAPPPGDSNGELTNTVVGPEESNCDDGTEEDCSTFTPIRELRIVKTADPEGAVTVGDTVTYTVAVTNPGTVDYTTEDPASVTDVMDGVLDDAVYNDDVTADRGEASFDDGTVSWTGPLAAGETATITYSVTADDPVSGDGTLVNAVLGPPEANCPVELPDDGEMPEACQVVTPLRAFEVSKTADVAEADPGDTVTYTVTVASTGTAPYTDDVPAGFSDNLTAVLDDAGWNDDATATAGGTSFSEPVLTWSGPLGVGDTVTVTYSVTVGDAGTGDGELVNVVAPADGSGGRCTSGDECTTHVDVVPPPDPGPDPGPGPGPDEPPAPGPDLPPGPGGLPVTGAGLVGAYLAAALFLGLTGAFFHRIGTRGRRPAEEPAQEG